MSVIYAEAPRVRQAGAVAAVTLKHKAEGPPPWSPYPHQVPPEGEWDVWALIAGRGAGKTEAGARYVDGHARGPACIEGPVPHRIAIVAPSHDDAVDTCVRGDSGLLSANRSIRFHPGAAKQADLTWPNGAEAELYGAFAPEDVERFRGPQHCLIWGDELAAWRKLDEAWDMLAFGLRLGSHPHMVVTTTPKRRPKLKAILSEPTTVISRATTADNPALPEARRKALYDKYGGTTLGRQELLAELIDDVPGALWRRDIIAYHLPPLNRFAKPDMVRLVVAIDPAISSTDDSDETGIVIAGMGVDGLGYTLGDITGRMAPMQWARRAIEAYHDYSADLIVAEANQGGDMVSTVIAQVDPKVPVKLVHASRGKRTRAEPVAALYEQGKWVHLEPFPDLEDQMCSFTGELGIKSPDRMDALVWAVTELQNIGEAGWGGGTWAAGASNGAAATTGWGSGWGTMRERAG